MIIDNADGLLQFYDLSGNPCYVGEKEVKLPMSVFPTYVTSAKGPKAAAERLAKTRISGKRPVEILPRDFTTRLTEKEAALTVGVHNCLNRPIKGKLTVESSLGDHARLRQPGDRTRRGRNQEPDFPCQGGAAPGVRRLSLQVQFHLRCRQRRVSGSAQLRRGPEGDDHC